MSLFGRYAKELMGREIIEKDYGFVTYLIRNDECYIEDIYIIPEERQKGRASQFADEIADTARNSGCTFLSGTVATKKRNAEANTMVLLRYGFKIHSADKDIIYFMKMLGDK